MNMSREEFNRVVHEGGMFKLSDDMFFGTIEQFADCFFSNVNYDTVIAFANEMEVELSEYTDEEHQEWLKGNPSHGK